MQAREFVGWAALAAVSLGATWATTTTDAATATPPPMPAPLPRLPTAAEAAEVSRLAAAVSAELRASAERVGRAPALQELEGVAPDGQPFLPTGLPDNPLAPGVAGVVDGCGDPPLPPAGVDWRYCAATLDFAPAHAGAVQSGKP